MPKKEIEGEIGDTHVGLQARLMSQSMRKLTGVIAKSKTAVIFINQIREKIGVMFGSPETTPGGRALKFYSSCRIDVRRIGQIKEGEEVDRPAGAGEGGQEQGRPAVPRRRVRHDVSRRHQLRRRRARPGREAKLIIRSGAWFRYGEIQLGQGREKTRDYLKENPELVEELKRETAGEPRRGQWQAALRVCPGDAVTSEEGSDGGRTAGL